MAQAPGLHGLVISYGDTIRQVLKKLKSHQRQASIMNTVYMLRGTV